jgi:hypothetical protein
MSTPAITEHSALSGDSKWHQALDMKSGDVLVQETEESNGVLVVIATRIERNGVVIKRIIERPPQPA